MTQSPPLPVAGVVKRLAAMVYDTLLLFGVLFTATIPAVFIGDTRAVDEDEVIHEVSAPASGLLFQAYLLLIVVIFFCWFWKKNGQTLGMQAWRLRLESRDGQPLTLMQCLRRLLAAVLSLGCLGCGYWWAWLDRDGLTWHDRLSGTRVVVVPKQQSDK